MEKSFEKKTITMEAAHHLIGEAQKKALEVGISIAITVVDESGVLKAFSRMDHAPLMAVDASRKKAVTAVGLGLSTGQSWYDFIKDDPILSDGVNGINDFILLGGGLPLFQDDVLIGGLGISGGHYTQDELCGRAALDKYFDQKKLP